jgi:hypothetical protein
MGAGGCLLWVAAQPARDSNGGYWEAMLLVGAAGLAVGLAQLRGRTGDPRAFFALVFLPVLVVAGWVLIALQPDGSWTRDHVLAWSADIGIDDAVRDVGTWAGVLAFAIGYALGLVAEPAPARVVVEEPVDHSATDAPTAAERREVGDTEVGDTEIRDTEARNPEVAPPPSVPR